MKSDIDRKSIVVLDQESAQESIDGLTDIIDQDIETIVAMRMGDERLVSRHQRVVEKVTNTVGRPVFLYMILLFIGCWILVNGFHSYLGLQSFDLPPFPWLTDIISLSSLLMTITILISQNRQSKLTEQRRHLDLQINLLTERKVSKLIELVEGLRQDNPIVKNHYDSEAEAMKQPVDPHTALTSLNETLKEAAKEYKLEVE